MSESQDMTNSSASVVDAGAVPFVHTTSQYEKLGVIVDSLLDNLLSAYATTTSPMIFTSQVKMR
jgi:hypothetical protein